MYSRSNNNRSYKEDSYDDIEHTAPHKHGANYKQADLTENGYRSLSHSPSVSHHTDSVSSSQSDTDADIMHHPRVHHSHHTDHSNHQQPHSSSPKTPPLPPSNPQFAYNNVHSSSSTAVTSIHSSVLREPKHRNAHHPDLQPLASLNDADDSTDSLPTESDDEDGHDHSMKRKDKHIEMLHSSAYEMSQLSQTDIDDTKAKTKALHHSNSSEEDEDDDIHENQLDGSLLYQMRINLKNRSNSEQHSRFYSSNSHPTMYTTQTSIGSGTKTSPPEKSSLIDEQLPHSNILPDDEDDTELSEHVQHDLHTQPPPHVNMHRYGADNVNQQPPEDTEYDDEEEEDDDFSQQSPPRDIFFNLNTKQIKVKPRYNTQSPSIPNTYSSPSGTSRSGTYPNLRDNKTRTSGKLDIIPINEHKEVEMSRSASSQTMITHSTNEHHPSTSDEWDFAHVHQFQFYAQHHRHQHTNSSLSQQSFQSLSHTSASSSSTSSSSTTTSSSQVSAASSVHSDTTSSTSTSSAASRSHSSSSHSDKGTAVPSTVRRSVSKSTTYTSVGSSFLNANAENMNANAPPQREQGHYDEHDSSMYHDREQDAATVNSSNITQFLKRRQRRRPAYKNNSASSSAPSSITMDNKMNSSSNTSSGSTVLSPPYRHTQGINGAHRAVEHLNSSTFSANHVPSNYHNESGTEMDDSLDEAKLQQMEIKQHVQQQQHAARTSEAPQFLTIAPAHYPPGSTSPTPTLQQLPSSIIPSPSSNMMTAVSTANTNTKSTTHTTANPPEFEVVHAPKANDTKHNLSKTKANTNRLGPMTRSHSDSSSENHVHQNLPPPEHEAEVGPNANKVQTLAVNNHAMEIEQPPTSKEDEHILAQYVSEENDKIMVDASKMNLRVTQPELNNVETDRSNATTTTTTYKTPNARRKMLNQNQIFFNQTDEEHANLNPDLYQITSKNTKQSSSGGPSNSVCSDHFTMQFTNIIDDIQQMEDQQMNELHQFHHPQQRGRPHAKSTKSPPGHHENNPFRKTQNDESDKHRSNSQPALCKVRNNPALLGNDSEAFKLFNKSVRVENHEDEEQKVLNIIRNNGSPGAAPESTRSASSNTKIKRLSLQIEKLQNQMDVMQKHWKKQETIYQQQIANLYDRQHLQSVNESDIQPQASVCSDGANQQLVMKPHHVKAKRSKSGPINTASPTNTSAKYSASLHRQTEPEKQILDRLKVLNPETLSQKQPGSRSTSEMHSKPRRSASTVISLQYSHKYQQYKHMHQYKEEESVELTEQSLNETKPALPEKEEFVNMTASYIRMNEQKKTLINGESATYNIVNVKENDSLDEEQSIDVAIDVEDTGIDHDGNHVLTVVEHEKLGAHKRLDRDGLDGVDDLLDDHEYDEAEQDDDEDVAADLEEEQKDTYRRDLACQEEEDEEKQMSLRKVSKPHKKRECDYFVSEFYQNDCPLWMNERWIRVIFLWVLLLWMMLNVVVIINGAIHYPLWSSMDSDKIDQNSVNITIVELWKIYELSTIYIWLQICFLLTLSILSVYWNINYFSKNPKENTMLRIVLMSMGSIMVICNLGGIVSESLPHDNSLNKSVGLHLQNVVKYMNYFVINVLSILIFCVCVFIIIMRAYINWCVYHKPSPPRILMEFVSTSNAKCYNNNMVTKCVWAILFCDIIIFLESMYTFQESVDLFDRGHHHLIYYKLEPLLRICIDTLLICLCIFFIHRTVVYQYIDYRVFNKYNIPTHQHTFEIATARHAQIVKRETDKMLALEYKAITFYDYLRLALCVSPIADIITDIWTIYVYFTYNESTFAWISLFILFISFRIHTVLWLLLKQRNTNFLVSNQNTNGTLSVFIWLLSVLPFASMIANCFITVCISSVDITFIFLSLTNELILLFAPVISPILIIYQSAKNFIVTFFLLKLQIYSIDKQQQVIDHLFSDGKITKKINNVFDDEYKLRRRHNKHDQQSNLTRAQIKWITRLRTLKHFGASIPQFILQTFVLIFYRHYFNQFRLTQYIISGLSSLFVLIQAILVAFHNHTLQRNTSRHISQ